MSEGVNVLAIIPARAGSKGIRNKNFRELAGRTPVERATRVCVEAGMSGVVSTDHEYHGSHFAGIIGGPFVEIRHLVRPPELAQDDTPMIDVVKHALQEIPGPPEQIVVLLQPTQPLRTPDHVRAAIALLASSGADSVVSVVEIPRTHSPHLACDIDAQGHLEPWLDDKADESPYLWSNVPSRRQDAHPAYIRDGTCYSFRRSTVAKHGNIYGEDCRALIIDPAETCPLDTEADWIEAERRLAR